MSGGQQMSGRIGKCSILFRSSIRLYFPPARSSFSVFDFRYIVPSFCIVSLRRLEPRAIFI